jgi:hypothetical protein
MYLMKIAIVGWRRQSQRGAQSQARRYTRSQRMATEKRAHRSGQD